MEGLDELKANLGPGARVLLPEDHAFKQSTKVWAVSPYHAPDVLPSPALVVQPRGESPSTCPEPGGNTRRAIPPSPRARQRCPPPTPSTSPRRHQ